MPSKLFVAVPSHSGGADGLTIECLLQLQRAALSAGIEISVRLHSGSMIPVLRNLIVSNFLSSDADTLLMLDSDQGVPGDSLMRMISHHAGVVGCLYPRRQYDWSLVDRGESAADMERVLYQASSFVGKLLATDEQNRAEVVSGFARAEYVGAGALVIKRDALKKMMDHFPELRGEGYSASEFSDQRFQHNWGFFNPLSRAEAGDVLPEDFSFCWRWRKAGGELWADVESVSGHAGRHIFAGAYLDYLSALGPR